MFCGSLLATAVIPLTLTADPRNGPTDANATWRGHIWWVGERGRLRWRIWTEPVTDDTIAFNWIHLPYPVLKIVPDDYFNVMWLLTVGGWYRFTFAESPHDDTARVTFVCRD